MVKVFCITTLALLFAGCATKPTSSELRARATELRKEAREVETVTLQQECDTKRKERNANVIAEVEKKEKDMALKDFNLLAITFLPDYCRNDKEKESELNGRVNDIVLRPEKK